MNNNIIEAFNYFCEMKKENEKLNKQNKTLTNKNRKLESEIVYLKIDLQSNVIYRRQDNEFWEAEMIAARKHQKKLTKELNRVMKGDKNEK